jgi:hypothetical protein
VVHYLAEGDHDERRRALHYLKRYDEPRAQVLIIQTLGDAVDQNDPVLFATAAVIVANRGEARALSMLARGAEYWQAQHLEGTAYEAEQAAHYIRRKLQGVELEPYRSVVFEEPDAGHGLDDEEEGDQGSGTRDQGAGIGD